LHMLFVIGPKCMMGHAIPISSQTSRILKFYVCHCQLRCDGSAFNRLLIAHKKGGHISVRTCAWHPTLTAAIN
jgi:hypothetical protein